MRDNHPTKANPNDEDFRDLTPYYAGKVVGAVASFKDECGYDVFQIWFTDGSCIECEEQGQAGHFDTHSFVCVTENN